MKTKNVLFILSLLCALSFISCTPGIRLNTQGAQDSQVSGTYTVIFYGCNFLDDLETIAFLDKEGDQYTFEPFAPAFRYSVQKGVDAKDAIAEAGRFVSCNTSFSRAQLSRVIGPDGDTLGYALKPLYHSFSYGVEDVLYTDYRIRGDKVVVTIRLAPSVENMLEGGGSHRRER
jgi:hypothetical protein